MLECMHECLETLGFAVRVGSRGLGRDGGEEYCGPSVYIYNGECVLSMRIIAVNLAGQSWVFYAQAENQESDGTINTLKVVFPTNHDVTWRQKLSRLVVYNLLKDELNPQMNRYINLHTLSTAESSLILEYLDIESVCNCFKTCSYANKWKNDHVLWQLLNSRDWGRGGSCHEYVDAFIRRRNEGTHLYKAGR